jgi:hypothetical protein
LNPKQTLSVTTGTGPRIPHPDRQTLICSWISRLDLQCPKIESQMSANVYLKQERPYFSRFVITPVPT